MDTISHLHQPQQRHHHRGRAIKGKVSRFAVLLLSPPYQTVTSQFSKPAFCYCSPASLSAGRASFYCTPHTPFRAAGCIFPCNHRIYHVHNTRELCRRTSNIVIYYVVYLHYKTIEQLISISRFNKSTANVSKHICQRLQLRTTTTPI